MIPPEGNPAHWLFLIAGGMVAIALVAALYRLVRGPSLPDRVVALDMVGFLAVVLLCVASIVTQTPSLLGVALVAALILFMGTAAFAIYLERRASQ
jgi:multicomponent Na+:H+ antiporter subunit F